MASFDIGNASATAPGRHKGRSRLAGARSAALEGDAATTHHRQAVQRSPRPAQADDVIPATIARVARPTRRFANSPVRPLVSHGACAAEPHIRSPLTAAAPKSFIPEVGGPASGTNLYHGISQPGHYTVRPLGSLRELTFAAESCLFVVHQQPFTIAPSGTSPHATYRQSAISSLRASATMAMRRIRPRSAPTRSRNQPLNALPG